MAQLISRYQLQCFHLRISHPHLHDGLFLDDDDAGFKSGTGTSRALSVAVQVLVLGSNSKTCAGFAEEQG